MSAYSLLVSKSNGFAIIKKKKWNTLLLFVLQGFFFFCFQIPAISCTIVLKFYADVK